MKTTTAPANLDAYVAALTGWRFECVEALRALVREAAELEEGIKWGHLVYFAKGPVLLIRAEERRVLFGFWRVTFRFVDGDVEIVNYEDYH